jgi:cytoskeleton protein RodZ
MSEEAQVSPSVGEELGAGAMLARARAERHLSIAEVAERLKYGARQIAALEADDYSRLPGTTFVRGMIRSYAKLLDLDAAPVLKALERRNIPAAATVDLRPQRIPFPDGSKRGTRLYLVLSLAVLLGIMAVLYETRMAEPEPVPAPVAARIVKVPPPPEPTVVAPAPAPEVEPAAAAEDKAPPAPRGDTGRIELQFQKESWVEIKDRVGRTLLSQLNPAGTQRVVEGSPPFSVIIGNAASVRVQYNDAPVDLKPYVKVEVARLTLE